MVQTFSIYQGQLRCEATHEPSGTTLLTDAPKDNHGLAESFSPTDLVGVALGTCILTTMALVARNKWKLELDGATARVEKEMVVTPTRRIGALNVAIEMPAHIPQEHREALEHAAHQCPVHKSMHPDVAMPISFVWK